MFTDPLPWVVRSQCHICTEQLTLTKCIQTRAKNVCCIFKYISFCRKLLESGSLESFAAFSTKKVGILLFVNHNWGYFDVFPHFSRKCAGPMSEGAPAWFSVSVLLQQRKSKKREWRSAVTEDHSQWPLVTCYGLARPVRSTALVFECRPNYCTSANFCQTQITV